MLDLNYFDLATNSDIGYDMPVINPYTNEEFEGATIRVRGDKSKTVVAFERKLYNEQDRARKVRVGKNKDEAPSLEELEDMVVRAAVVRIMGWKGFKEDGMAFEYSPENAEVLMKKHDWLREQVRDAAKELENFRPE